MCVYEYQVVREIRVCVRVCVHVWVGGWVAGWVYVCVWGWVGACMCQVVREYTCAHEGCVYVRVCVCVHVRACVCVYIFDI